MGMLQQSIFLTFFNKQKGNRDWIVRMELLEGQRKVYKKKKPRQLNCRGCTLISYTKH